MIIKLNKRDPISSLYHYVKRKIKNINSTDYQIYQQSHLPFGNDVPLHNSMQAKDLPIRHLVLKKRKFFDMPQKTSKECTDTFQYIKRFDIDGKYATTSGNLKTVLNYNEMTACVYESFQVIQHHKSGKKERIMLAVDGNKIYMFRRKGNSEEHHRGRPQRFLNEIKEYKLLMDNLIQLKLKDESRVRGFVVKVFQSNQAEKIFLKLDYLLRIMLKKFSRCQTTINLLTLAYPPILTDLTRGM